MDFNTLTLKSQEAVAAAQGIVLDADPEELIDHAAKREVAYDHKASMLQDVLAGCKTEIEAINGAVVAVAHAAGIAAPSTECLLQLVRLVDARGAC